MHGFVGSKNNKTLGYLKCLADFVYFTLKTKARDWNRRAFVCIAIKLFCILYIHNFNLEMKWRIRGNSVIPIFVFSGATVITIR